MREKYIIAQYLRLSSEDGDKQESDSISNQRKLINFHINKNFINSDVEVIEFVDDGYTGTNLNRPGLRKLLILAETHEINCIIVKDFSRFARNYIESGLYLDKKFPAWNIRFISVNDGYDSLALKGITGGVDIAFKNIAYEMYSRDLSKKVQSSKRIIAQKGEYLGGGMYGYRKSSNGKRMLVVDPVSAEIVKRIFDMYINGEKKMDIAKSLNKDNIPTPSQYKQIINPKYKNNKICAKWNAHMIGNILRNEQYTGKLVSGRYIRSRFAIKGQTRYSDEEIIVVNNCHEAIIPQEIFDSVQTKKRKKEVGNSYNFLLTGLIRCGGCGRAMNLTSMAASCRKYVCKYKKYDDNCIQEKILESEILGIVENCIRTELNKTVNVKAILEQARHTQKNYEKQIQEINKKIEVEKKKKLNYYVQFTKGIIDNERLKEVCDEIDIKVIEYENRRSELSKNKVSADDTSFVNLFEKYVGLENITREVLVDLIKAIYVYPDKRIKIIWNFKEVVSV